MEYEDIVDERFIRQTAAGFGYEMDSPISSLASVLVDRGYTMSSVRKRFW